MGLFDTLVSDIRQKMEREVERTRGEILMIKTGKASPGLIEGLIVETYAGSTKLRLMELASISTESSSELLIAPFDPETVRDIERAILMSPLSLTPRVDGKNIHIKIPPLTEEQRLKLLKTVAQKIEEGKVLIRTRRDEVRKKVRQAFDSKELSEDQKFRVEKEIDKITQEYTKSLDELKQKKEKDLMEI